MANDDPLTPEEVAKLEPEPATEPPPAEQHVIATSFLTSSKDDPHPVVGSRLTRLGSARGSTTWQVDLTTNLTGGPGSPPRCELFPVDKPKRPSRRARDEDGYRPPWVEMRPAPRTARLSPPNRVFRGEEELEPLTIFPPDGRKSYFDTSYPWGSVCKVTTPKGGGSGVLIGHRHVLTASHMIDWNNPGGTVAAHMWSNFNLGTAAISGIYWWTKVGSPTFSTVDEDYVVLVLNSNLGDKVGYLGYRTYDSSWDGKAWWKTIGYPGDLGAGIVPAVQHDFKLDEDDFDFGPARAMSSKDGDVMPGQSGSPVFTWFKSSKTPKVVGVVSATVKKGGPNYFSGGSWLTDLIAYARQHSP
jgi:V8-like Glu-specific endopeptidase